MNKKNFCQRYRVCIIQGVMVKKQGLCHKLFQQNRLLTAINGGIYQWPSRPAVLWQAGIGRQLGGLCFLFHIPCISVPNHHPYRFSIFAPHLNY